MQTTTLVNAEARAASTGGSSTPVQLALQGNTFKLSLELLIASTRASGNSTVGANIVSPIEANLRSQFKLYWATSSQDLSGSLSQVPTLLSHLIRPKDCVLDRYRAQESFQVFEKCLHGKYLYVWYDYPQSPDAYAVTILATEYGVATSLTPATGGSALTAVKIDNAAGGDIVVKTATTAKKTKLWRLLLVVGGDTNITIKDGSTALTGAMPMLANGSITLDFSGDPWFTGSTNTAFNINSSNAVQVSGTAYITTD